jgi:hypothetical protein
MNKLFARIALITVCAASPSLVLAGEGGKDDKKPAEKADAKKAPVKKETKEEKKPAPSGW